MDTLDGSRTRISATFGYSNTRWAVAPFFDALTERLSRRFGGLRIVSGDGYWRSDENGDPPHVGRLHREVSRTVVFVTDRAKDDALQILKWAATESAESVRGDVPMEWVNVEISTVEAAHFSIPENTTYLDGPISDRGSAPGSSGLDGFLQEEETAQQEEPGQEERNGRPLYRGAAISSRNVDAGPHGY